MGFLTEFRVSDRDDGVVQRRIIEAVRERWKNKQSACLLSQLGNDFRSELPTTLSGRKLIDVIAKDFDASLRLVSKGYGNETVWAVVPAEVDSALGEKSIPTAAPQDTIRFHPTVWAAFRTPLTKGHQRFLVQQGKTHKFIDLPAGEPTPQRTLLNIRADDIVGANVAAENVSEHIKRVLQKEDISLDRVAAGRSAPTTPVLAATSTHLLEHHTLLDALLECLTPSEARRVSLPLDVLQKLRRSAAIRG